MAYTGNVPATQYTSTVKDTFNGDGTTTDFTLSRPSLVNNLEVFVENVQQEPTTAYTVSGTTLSFTSAPVSGTGNIYVIHRGQAVQMIVPPAGISLNATDASITNGLTVDKDGATVATFDRATSDGTIVDLQKDGSSVGVIKSLNGDMLIGTGTAGLAFQDYYPAIVPYNATTSGNQNNAVDLGNSGSVFRNVYVGGGVYLGGTGAANHLDDYEEGTWTPTFVGGTVTNSYGRYVKVGNVVHIEFGFANGAITGTLTGDPGVTGFPFTSEANRSSGSVTYLGIFSGSDNTTFLKQPSTTDGVFLQMNSGSDWTANGIGTGSGKYLHVSLTYATA